MKKIRIQLYPVIGIALLAILNSCDKFMDVNSREQISDLSLWSSTANADLFLNNVYASLQGPFNTLDPEENWTDNSVSGVNGEYSQAVYAISAYTPSDSRHRWGYYSAIRKCNLFIEKATNSQLPEDWKKQRLAEARFLRAYYYMILWTSHGGVPIVTRVLNQTEQGDAIYQERNTAEETFNFIKDECEAIADDLPLVSDPGRVTRGAALTLKGWVELFWASPLSNPANEKQRWVNAAATYKRVIELNVYELFPDYNKQFFEENNGNKETIFAKTYLGGTSLGGSREGFQGPWMVNNQQKSWGGVNPTQEIVDTYFMANGLDINDPASGYNPQNPYENREKRFYESIVYDGAEWLGYEMIMKQGVGSRNETDFGNGEGTKTGYYLRKGMNPTYTVPGGNFLNGANYIIYRYAEVLLSYAEAQNEANGPDASIYDALNLLRERVDLPVLEPGLTKEEMRIAIQKERRVELAFEEKRWLDLIRLKLAEINLNKASQAISIEKIDGNWTYKIKPSVHGNRIFKPEKNYVLPIPQEAIDRNPKLKQNPNY